MIAMTTPETIGMLSVYVIALVITVILFRELNSVLHDVKDCAFSIVVDLKNFALNLPANTVWFIRSIVPTTIAIARAIPGNAMKALKLGAFLAAILSLALSPAWAVTMAYVISRHEWQAIGKLMMMAGVGLASVLYSRALLLSFLPQRKESAA